MAGSCEGGNEPAGSIKGISPPASETVASISEETARIPGEPAGIPSEPARIPADYELIPELGYYKFHTSLKTWHEALKVCEEEGGHLAVLNSEREAKALGIFWDRNPKFGDTEQSKWAHVGFHDSYKEGEYVTIFNKTIVESGYATWYGNDPDGGTNQNCGMASRKENLLADESCTYKTGFFCEIELP
ncbi:hypothetical protein ANN_12891 [Periplaneta americana]|uniref:C-type lectin domain-containing protein n=1 Tax=Periplaneta americana TaxID=6978 RepID=A0ABQ8TJQ6_PERAM|nr:hypothetical protein ANN_12891 [Periplaneta americana]